MNLVRQTPRRPHDARLGLAHEKLWYLFEISTLLTRFESVEQTMPTIVATAARALPLRSSILVLETETRGKPRIETWHRKNETGYRLREAVARAKASYGYLTGCQLPPEPNESARARVQPGKRPSKRKYVLLPLVVEKCPVFGALQIEVDRELTEIDLVFINALVNQLSVALDRQALIEARQLAADRARAKAETTIVAAEARRAEAQTKQATAERGHDLIRGAFAFARDVSASLGEGVIVIDLAGRITLFNPAAEELIGCKIEVALGRNVHDIVEVRRTDGMRLSAEDNPFDRVMRLGALTRNDEHVFSSLCGAHKRLSVSYVCAPLRRAGQVSGAVLAFQDIMDVKRAAKEQHILADVSGILASSLAYRETLAAVARFTVPLLADICFIDELTPDGSTQRLEVVFADEQKQRDLSEAVRRFSPPAGLRTPAGTVLASGKSLLLKNIDAAAMSAYDEEYAKVLRAAGARSMVAVPLIARGATLGVLSFISAESGRRYSSSDRDLAEQIGQRAALAIDNARLYERAQRATRSRQDVLADVSHDLKNPLSVILMSVELLLEAAGPDDRRRSKKELAAIKRSAEGMDHLVHDLLDTASLDANHLSLELQHVQIAPQIAKALEDVAQLASTKSIRLVSEVPDDLPAVTADVARLTQVFTNLLTNAIKFTKSPATIIVRVERCSEGLRISVVDQGPGIAEEDLPHLFDRFWQAGENARRGTGLGLGIVKGIVEAHGGHVWVESKVGEGSTFLFSLPIVHPDLGCSMDATMDQTSPRST